MIRSIITGQKHPREKPSEEHTNELEKSEVYVEMLAKKLGESEQKHRETLINIKQNLKSYLNQASQSLETILTDLDNFTSFHDELNQFFVKIMQSLKTIQASGQGLQKAFEAIASKSQMLDNIEEMLVNRSSSSEATLRNLDEIRKLAEKTEIISYNASIEAAHAGLHGKGFAVISRQLSRFSVDIREIVNETSKGVVSITNDLSGIDKHFASAKKEIDNQLSQMSMTVENSLTESESLESELMAQTQLMKEKIEGFQQLSDNVATIIERHSHDSSNLIGALENHLIPDLDCREAQKKLNDFVIIDVRSKEEFFGELGHIPQAQLITIDDQFERALQSLSKEATYLFVCRSGGRSARAAQIALDLGFTNIFNLKGGMLSWNDQRCPVDHDVQASN